LFIAAGFSAFQLSEGFLRVFISKYVKIYLPLLQIYFSIYKYLKRNAIGTLRLSWKIFGHSECHAICKGDILLYL